MTGRPMDDAVAAAFENSVIYPCYMVRLDIENDPVYVWTGVGPLSFDTGSSDPQLDGLIFDGMGNFGSIGSINDQEGGSQAVKLSLPGVDPNDDLLKQIVFDHQRWQFRTAYIWVGLTDSDGNLLGTPVRVKTGHIDQLVLTEQGGNGTDATVEVTIESHMAYAGEALNTRYSEQREVDPTDTSQDYVHDLANQTVSLHEAPKGLSAASNAQQLPNAGLIFRIANQANGSTNIMLPV